MLEFWQNGKPKPFVFQSLKGIWGFCDVKTPYSLLYSIFEVRMRESVEDLDIQRIGHAKPYCDDDRDRTSIKHLGACANHFCKSDRPTKGGPSACALSGEVVEKYSHPLAQPSLNSKQKRLCRHVLLLHLCALLCHSNRHRACRTECYLAPA